MRAGRKQPKSRRHARKLPSKQLSQSPVITSAATNPVERSVGSAEGYRQAHHLWWTGCVVAVVIVWAYWGTLTHLAERWSAESEYSHGFLVPVVALALLWFRRGQVAGQALVGHWGGLVLIAIGVVMRLVSSYWFFSLVGAYALLPTLAGLALVIGGRRVLIWALPSIALLVFMIPLPGFVSSLMSHPLQRVATICSTYLIQLFGIPAVAAGNVIFLRESKIGVIEACSGLRMLILFFAVATAVAMFVKRPLWERGLLIVSAVPIALCANIARIVITGLLQDILGESIAGHFYHDMAGLLMGPLALLFLWFEIRFLDHALMTIDDRPVNFAALGTKPA